MTKAIVTAINGSNVRVHILEHTEYKNQINCRYTITKDAIIPIDMEDTFSDQLPFKYVWESE
jgi:hypothetical protein